MTPDQKRELVRVPFVLGVFVAVILFFRLSPDPSNISSHVTIFQILTALGGFGCLAFLYFHD